MKKKEERRREGEKGEGGGGGGRRRRRKEEEEEKLSPVLSARCWQDFSDFPKVEKNQCVLIGFQLFFQAKSWKISMPLYRVSTFLAKHKTALFQCLLIGFQLFWTVSEKLKPYN